MRSFHPVVLLALVAIGFAGAFALGRQSGPGAHAAAPRDFTCSMHPQVHAEAPGLCPMCRMELVPAAAGGSPPGAADAMHIDPALVQNAGVRVAQVRRGELVADLRLSGSIAVARDRVRDITLKFSGFVEVLHANQIGMAIHRGDSLFEFYSPDLIVAEERLLSAKKSGEPGPLQTARQRLERWDIAAATIDGLLAGDAVPRTIPWPSPFDGLLVESDVVQGGRLDTGMRALRIADLTTVWVEAAVPESQLPGVAVGMTADIELSTQPGVTLHGKVAVVAPVVDERTRTGTLRIELPNPDGRLLPGMFARVHLRTVRKPDAVLLPDAAVLETGARSICWLALGDGRFAPRELRLGEAGAGGVIEVLDGVAVGETVVTSGQLLIDADSRLRQHAFKFATDDLLAAGPLSVPAPATADAAAQGAIDALVTAYLQLGAALAADRDDAAAWQRLGVAATALGTSAAGRAGGADRIAAAVAVTASDLGERRQAFLALSEALVPVVEQVRPSASLGKELLVVHCSMKPGSWLQTDRDVRNPYYGSEMLACGTVLRVLPTLAGGGR